MTSVEFTVLGCGNSAGVPAVGNMWGHCDPDEPKNRRTRPSVAISSETTTLVVDTGPDFAMQCNAANLNQLDAVLYTHPHGDHINGIDDLRVWTKALGMDTMPVYGTRETLDDLIWRYDYMFQCKNNLYPQALTAHYLDENLYTPMRIGDITFTAFLQDHGTINSLGFRFGRVGYSTDMRNLDDKAIECLKGVDVWIVDCAGYKHANPSVHANIERVMHFNEQIGAEQVYFTHMSAFMDYTTLIDETPEGYQPAYDGLAFKL